MEGNSGGVRVATQRGFALSAGSGLGLVPFKDHPGKRVHAILAAVFEEPADFPKRKTHSLRVSP